MITTSLFAPSTLNASSLSFDTIKSESVASLLIVTFELAPGLIVTAVGIFAKAEAIDIFLSAHPLTVDVANAWPY